MTVPSLSQQLPLSLKTLTYAGRTGGSPLQTTFFWNVTRNYAIEVACLESDLWFIDHPFPHWPLDPSCVLLHPVMLTALTSCP